MVSCTRIESTLQAYIDGDLGDSERVIFEQHFADCDQCRESLTNQKRANAALYGVFSNDRLQGSLRHRVLAHLPEMEVIPRDSDSVVDLINERAKNPRTAWSIVGRLMPAAAIAILLFVTLVLRYSVTDTKSSGTFNMIGMITHTSGATAQAVGNGPDSGPAQLQSYVARGDRLETQQGSSLMMSLAGPTLLKLGNSTRVLINDSRNITLDYGQVWLDVGRNGKLFQVHTPRGEVTVFGTCFTVSYIDELTTVTVERGKVQLEKDEDFRVLTAGEQAEVLRDGNLTNTTIVDAKLANAWARRITPDPAAENVFSNRVQMKAPSGELPARLVYVANTYGRTVSALRLYWQPQRINGVLTTDYYAYDLYVSASDGAPIMHKKLDVSRFIKEDDSSTDIELDAPISGMKSIEIRLVPDYKSGRTELLDVDFKAVVLDETTVEVGS